MKGRGHPAGRSRTLRQSLEEYARGVAGGLLFSLPLIYTMEVWWAGFIARPVPLLLYFAAGFSLLLQRFPGLGPRGSPRGAGAGEVPVTVRNEGEATAESVRGVVTLELPDGGKEEAELEIPFVPRHSRREGWVHFLHPPATGRLSGRVTGYEQP